MIWNKIREIAGEISTRPNQTSWRWKGKVSPLAYILLHFIYLARIFSLLQICKYVYRKLANSSVDKSSKRKNIPSWFVECYFFVWLILLLALPKEWGFSTGCSYYFLFESLIWLLYYFFFRRFFEEKYAIMHALEYIVLLPLLIIIQTRCVSILDDCSFQYAFGILFFPEKDDGTYSIIFSVLYTALIFGIFLSSMPLESVKEKGNYRFYYSIIGNGKIVQNRLKEAIAERNKMLTDIRRKVVIMDNQDVSQESNSKDHKKTDFTYIQFNVLEDIDKNVLSSKVLWIATPSFVHINYLNRYIDQVFIAVEKPLVTNRSELTLVKHLREKGIWKKVFCLSYYYLEKALPLTFLFSPSTFYEKYLDFYGKRREEVLSSYAQLGKLKSVNLQLFEGEDDRDWVNVPQYGGHLFETFLHLAVVARDVMGEETDWGQPEWIIENTNGHYMSHIKCAGKTVNGINYDLEMKKFSDPSELKRGGMLKYERGTIHVDMEEQCIKAEVMLNKTIFVEIFQIGIKNNYKTKYSIQVDMVERCCEENIVPAVVDGSELQVKTLEWMFAQESEWGKVISELKDDM